MADFSPVLRTCGSCRGTGDRHRLPCMACKGAGLVWCEVPEGLRGDDVFGVGEGRVGNDDSRSATNE